jgi:RNA polymerase sigma-70 factor (ECF subfamily)
VLDQLETKVSDEALMQSFQSGDRHAMEELFARYYRRVYGFAWRMVGHRETAEDLVQETFLRICRAKASFRGQSRFGTWLYIIASNTCRDHLRRQKRRPELPLAEDWEEALTDYPLSSTGAVHVEREVLRREEGRRIRQAMEQLSPKERMALILREYEGLDYKEIAEVMGSPLGSVKVLLYRARQHLKQRLQSELKDPS